MGDETQEQKGTHVANTLPPPTGLTEDEIKATLAQIKLPPGFKIELWATGLAAPRQMAWGDKGTLFVGSWFGTGGAVYAVTDQGGKRTVKTVIKGMRVPTGVAFRDGALYVADVDKIYKYDNAEAALDNMPQPQVVYDDLPAYIPHGWKYLAFDKEGWLYVPIGPPCNECLPPTSTSQIRRVNPANGGGGNRRAWRAQQCRRRCRSAHRRLLVQRERARLAGRQHSERQTQSHHKDRRTIWAIRIAIRATSRTRNSPWGINARSFRLRRSSSARTSLRWA